MTDNAPVFRPLDRDRDVEVRERNLPHWFQAASAIFVTFRTEDSLPKEVILRMQRELEDWLRNRNLPAELAMSAVTEKRVDHSHLLNSLDPAARTKFRRLVNRLFHGSLDECHGKCVLRQSSIAQIVANAIRHDNGVKFDLDRFVIMPNLITYFARQNNLSGRRSTSRRTHQMQIYARENSCCGSEVRGGG
jgi:putative transposase